MILVIISNSGIFSGINLFLMFSNLLNSCLLILLETFVLVFSEYRICRFCLI